MAAPAKPADTLRPTPASASWTAARCPVQWNIERGYQLAGIIEELRRIDADILSLQEVDVGCDRSGGVDTGATPAPGLGFAHVTPLYNFAAICWGATMGRAGALAMRAPLPLSLPHKPPTMLTAATCALSQALR